MWGDIIRYEDVFASKLKTMYHRFLLAKNGARFIDRTHRLSPLGEALKKDFEEQMFKARGEMQLPDEISDYVCLFDKEVDAKEVYNLLEEEDLGDILTNIRRCYWHHAFSLTNSSSGAAKLLGIPRSNFQYYCDDFGIDRNRQTTGRMDWNGSEIGYGAAVGIKVSSYHRPKLEEELSKKRARHYMDKIKQFAQSVEADLDDRDMVQCPLILPIAFSDVLDELERKLISAVYAHEEYNQSSTAEALGMKSRTSLQYRLKKLVIERPDQNI